MYYGAHISQGCIREQLAHLGIVISAGQVNNILTKKHDSLHEEAEKILETGLRYSNYICVDDTGLRHKGKNGNCSKNGYIYIQNIRQYNYVIRMEGFDIDSIRGEEKNGVVIGLLGLLEQCEVEIKKKDVEIKNKDAEIKKKDIEITKLKEEITRLKNHPSKPKLKPSIIGKKDKSIHLYRIVVR